MASPDSNEPTGPTGAPRGAARFFGRRPSLQTPTEALHPDTPPAPPVLPNSRRRPMLSTVSGILSFVVILAVGGLGFLAYASSRLAEPGPLQAEKVVFIAPRTEVSDIVDQLEKAGVIRQALVMKAALVLDQKWSQVKAGEYMFKQHASLNEVIDTLVSGRAVLHSVTIPEGLTSEQIVERLRQNDLLTGEITEIPAEGTLLPETYRVLRGQARSSILRQMRDQQTRLLDQIWERRSREIPVRSKIELLTLASIVEKETGRADERTRVAAVFYNRLRRGMKLQSDPTIVYGLVGGKGTLGRPIQKDEIVRPSRYNTYVIPALPPGPIANPGRASMEAAANPSLTNDLFFVANGTGGHAFAESLEQHNRNVQRWRDVERERAATRAAQPASATGGEANQNDRVSPGADADPSAPAATSPARGRRSDLPGGEVFGEVPADLIGRAVAISDLTGALKSIAGGPVANPRDSARGSRQARAVAPAQPATPPAIAPSTVAAAPPPALPAVVTTGAPAREPETHIAAYAPVQPPMAYAALSGSSPTLPGGQLLAPRPIGQPAPSAAPASAPAAIAAAAPSPAAPTHLVPASSVSAPSAPANAAPATAEPTKAPANFAIGRSLDDINLNIAGVHTGPSPLDGPADDGGATTPANMETYPVEASRRHEMNARAAMYGTGVAAAGPIETFNPAQGNAQTPLPDQQPRVRKIIDASEGTAIDPLRNKTWDLNAAQQVPAALVPPAPTRTSARTPAKPPARTSATTPGKTTGKTPAKTSASPRD